MRVKKKRKFRWKRREKWRKQEWSEWKWPVTGVHEGLVFWCSVNPSHASPTHQYTHPRPHVRLHSYQCPPGSPARKHRQWCHKRGTQRSTAVGLSLLTVIKDKTHSPRQYESSYEALLTDGLAERHYDYRATADDQLTAWIGDHVGFQRWDFSHFFKSNLWLLYLCNFRYI